MVSGARGVRSSPGRVALGMPPSPPGLGFLICEVGVTVGPPPPDARGGDCDNGSRSKPGRVARLRARPLLAEGRAGPCGGGRTRAGTALRVQLRPVGDTGTRTGPSSRCQGTAGLGRGRPAALRARRVRVRPAGPGRGRGGRAAPGGLRTAGRAVPRPQDVSLALGFLRPPPPSRPNACGLVAGDRPEAHRAAAAAFCPRTDQPEDGPACRASTPGRVSLRRLTAETPASKRPARQQA